MKLFAKAALASMLLASMMHADTMLIGVDAGLTVGGARLGVVAGVTGGSARSYTAPSSGSYTSCPKACPTACPTVRVVKSNPCDYVCGPCEVIAPPCKVVACDPCAR